VSVSVILEKEKPAFVAVGKEVQFVDAKEMARGRVLYTADLKLPGMLEAGVLRSPHAHAKILKIDTSAAESLPGVKAVITGARAPSVKYGMGVNDETVLPLHKIRHSGEEVAAVAAVDHDVVEEALSLIRVEYEELPSVLDVEEALAPSAPVIHDDKPNNILQHFTIKHGDIDEGFRKSDLIVEGSYSTQIVHPSYVEPIASLANYDSGGMLAIWISTQDPFGVRDTFSRVLGIPESKIRIYQTYVGGGFGGKIDSAYKCGLITSLLSMKSGRPVRLTLKRDEELAGATRTRHALKCHLKMGVKRDGTLIAKESKSIVNAGAYASLAYSVINNVATRWDCLYRLKYLNHDLTLVYTNATPAGAFRGLGNVQPTFANECMMDEIAERLDMDPLKLRLMNASRQGDTTMHGWNLRTCGLSECLQKAAQEASWTNKRNIYKSANQRSPKRRGIGVSCGTHHSSVRRAGRNEVSTARVTINRDGTISIATGQADIGSGQNTVFTIIASEVLGSSVGDVKVTRVDTDLSPYTRGTVSSRGTVITGNAVHLAAEDAKRQLLEAASKVLKVPVATLTLNGKQISAQTGKSIHVSEAAAFAIDHGSPIVGIATYDPPTDVATPQNNLYGDVSPNYPFAAHIAEVEVDLETGEVKLLNYVAAHDIGRAISRMGVEGQIEGAVAQGIGYALTEQMIYEKGVVVNSNFLDYKLASAKDMPPVKTVLVETNDPGGPFGAKSIGELSLVPVAPAIANAIRNATGINPTRLPMTPEYVFNEMNSREKRFGH
jgi:CO/xanthine dehydrogenase Mo-binding subunit